MPSRRSDTPLLAFKFETAPLHSLFTNKEHASFQLLYHDATGKKGEDHDDNRLHHRWQGNGIRIG